MPEKNNYERIVDENIALVHSIVKRYAGHDAEYEDLFQTGCIGLYNAAKRFNPELGFAFSTYAASLIIGEIKRYLRDDGIIKVSRHLKEVSAKAGICIKNFTAEHGREPSLGELSKESGISAEELTCALDARRKPVSIFEESADGKTIADTICDNEQNGDGLINSIVIKTAMKKIPERERKIIVYRYYRDKTQKETACLLGISQVQVSRIERKALDKIKRELIK